MIVHQAISEETPLAILDGRAQHAQVHEAVEIIFEDHPLVVPTRIDVEDTALNLFAQLAWHSWQRGVAADSAPEPSTTLKGV